MDDEETDNTQPPLRRCLRGRENGSESGEEPGECRRRKEARVHNVKRRFTSSRLSWRLCEVQHRDGEAGVEVSPPSDAGGHSGLGRGNGENLRDHRYYMNCAYCQATSPTALNNEIAHPTADSRSTHTQRTSAPSLCATFPLQDRMSDSPIVKATVGNYPSSPPLDSFWGLDSDLATHRAFLEWTESGARTMSCFRAEAFSISQNQLLR